MEFNCIDSAIKTEGNRVEKIWIQHIYDETSKPELSGEPEYAAQDQARIDSWKRDDWHYIGIKVKCVVSRPIGGTSRRLQEFDSAGLWGIESDSGNEYLLEVATEQLEDLRQHLAAFNVPLTTEGIKVEDLKVDYR